MILARSKEEGAAHSGAAASAGYDAWFAEKRVKGGRREVRAVSGVEGCRYVHSGWTTAPAKGAP